VHTARALACSAGAIAAAIAVSACESSGSTLKTSQPATSAKSKPSTSSTPSSSAPPRLVTKLAGSCDTLLPQIEVEELMGIHFVGKNAYVVGIPEKNIGRLGYLNCRYGLGASGKGTPTVEVGISLYKSPAQAEKRLAGSVQDYRDHGATPSSATVAGNDATMLVGGTSRGYNIPLLVVASDQRTVAVSVVPNLLAAGQRQLKMEKLAALALQRTAP
jgi:hypothetical protein